MRTPISSLSLEQLKIAISIREEIEKLQTQLNNLDSGSNASHGKTGRRMSAASRARISAGMRAKWAARKGVSPKKRKMSAAGREAIRAAQKARWAKVKAGK